MTFTREQMAYLAELDDLNAARLLKELRDAPVDWVVPDPNGWEHAAAVDELRQERGQ